MSKTTVGEGLGGEKEESSPFGSLRVGFRETTPPGIVPDGVASEELPESGRVEESPLSGGGDWVGFKNTVEVTVIVAGPSPGGVEEEGSPENVDEGLKNGSNEDGSIEREELVDDVENGSKEDVVEDGLAAVENGSKEDVVEEGLMAGVDSSGVLLERVTL